MWISRYFVLFTLFSCLGWIYETCYCTVKTGKWDNRGFLFGPVCPIYGTGGVGIGIVFDLIQKSGKGGDILWWHIFIIAYLGSVVLEYVTHFILEKKFHAYWWDYSKMPLNIKGRVCVPASIGFGCAGLLIYYIIYPNVAKYVNPIPAIIMELLSLLCMGLLASDTALTVAALTNVVKNMENMEDNINRQMETLVTTIGDKKAGMENALENSRELLTTKTLERTLHGMSGVGRASLKRIKGFRIQETGVSKYNPVNMKHLSRIWQMAKNSNAIQMVKEKLPGKED